MQFVNKLNWPLIAFVSVIGKSLIVPVSMADAFVLIPVVSLMGYQLYVQNVKVSPYQEKFDTELSNIRKELDERMFRQAEALAKELKEMNSKVTSIKTKEQIQAVSPGERRYF